MKTVPWKRGGFCGWLISGFLGVLLGFSRVLVWFSRVFVYDFLRLSRVKSQGSLVEGALLLMPFGT